ncbi:tripartite tricarboxylate transporter TctB family protein [Kineococcus indalonis]|uniref:tripartite tricarboxylate transporter TctB family protein n=1 Tax=Kineococcus indalonis TaxID=2696566 RepID=UPI001411D715|nr:tripartite tricarboxylate transporter TctB family protein [Kineococcus indalonis]NAZ85373.1 tripartite tricarboxylate transporter TctB family protein [Kineococcus indalonis]
MSATAAPRAAATRAPRRRRDLSQLGVCVLLLALGAVVFADTATLSQGLVDEGVVGPRPVPYVVAAGLVLTAVALAVDVLRGGRGQVEDGEDVDLSAGTDWARLGVLALVFAANVLLVERLGWVVSAAVFFGATAKVLGGRSLLRGIAVGAVLSLLTFYFFWTVLGIQLPPGVLDGVL